MARSRWKFLTFSNIVWRFIFHKKINKDYKVKRKKTLWMYTRGSTIPKCMFKKTPSIYSGRLFFRIKLRKFHIGSKFGEYALTRKIFYYPMRKKIKPRR